MAMTNTMTASKGFVRKAADCTIVPPGQEDALHRASQSAFDFRLQEMTGDMARGMGILTGFCADKPHYASPWHYHECEMQIGIVLDGSVEMAFTESDVSRIAKGDICLIPGGVIHDVTHPSSDYVTTEFTFPGSFATIDALVPAAGSPSKGRRLGISDALRSGEERGFIRYDYPVESPYDERYAVSRDRLSRIDPFVPGLIENEHDLFLLFVLQGRRVVELNGDNLVLEAGDLLVLPRGSSCMDMDASPEHEALRIHLLAGLSE